MADINMGVALDWDSVIEKESEFVLLDDGEYDFTVTDLERGRFDGSERMGACPVAKVTLEINSAAGKAKLTERLYLISSNEWKLSAFFGCIGQKKHGEKLQMDWSKVVGSTGRAKIGHREYKGKTYNDIKTYIYKEDTAPPAAGGFKAGKF